MSTNIFSCLVRGPKFSRHNLRMQAPLSQTLCNPAIEQSFMQSFALHAAEVHQNWKDHDRDMTATGRQLGIDCHAVVRELQRHMKKDLRSGEEALHILSKTDPRTWGGAHMMPEMAWESLETEFLLWTAYVLR